MDAGRLNTSYDRIAPEFAAARGKFRPGEADYLARLLAPLAPGDPVLDLGCGNGFPIAAEIVRRGFRVTGVDASARLLEQAKAHLPTQRWVHARMEEVELPGTFGAIVCWDALFHLPRRSFAPVLARVQRWLAPGGRFLVSSGGSDDEDGEGFVDTMFGHEFYYDSLSPRQMAATANALGFKLLVSEMCDRPDGDRNKGKWAMLMEKPT